MLERLVDEATLRRAEGLAGRWRVSIQEVLITLGWIAEEEYVRALARHLQLPVADAEQLERSRSRTPYPPSPKVLGVALEDQELVVIEARAFSPHVLRSISAGRASSARFCLASRATITRAAERQVAPLLVDKAVNGLWRQAARSSARTRHYLWQAMLAAVFCGLAVGGLVAAPELAAPTLAALLAVPFLCVVALRTSAAIEILRPSRRTALPDAAERQAEAELPLYSVLVPLLREAAVLPRLVHALSSLDYPAAKLQILLALESDDAETRAAAGALDLPGNFEIVLVPQSGPRTKPKALNYALELARGEFVVVYDAEDVPAPDQIRRAVAVFRGAPGSLACIQARLNIYNQTMVG